MTDAEIIEIIRAYAIFNEYCEILRKILERELNVKCGRNQ